MTLNQFKKALKEANKLDFRLPNGQLIPDHFHITEVGESTKKFIDCGNTIHEDKHIVFQLWHDDHDLNHRLSTDKLSSIIEKSEKVLQLENLEIIVEYQLNSIGKFELSHNSDGTFQLHKTQTNCIAKEACGITPQKKKIVLNYLKNTECTPNSGCC